MTSQFPRISIVACSPAPCAPPPFPQVSVFKKFFLKSESRYLEFRAEFFNAFNHANFNNPDGGFDSPTFGQVLGSDYARQIQFGLKFMF